jgi:hypothetical protein
VQHPDDAGDPPDYAKHLEEFLTAMAIVFVGGVVASVPVVADLGGWRAAALAAPGAAAFLYGLARLRAA